jgi:hypothetical protein
MVDKCCTGGERGMLEQPAYLFARICRRFRYVSAVVHMPLSELFQRVAERRVEERARR